MSKQDALRRARLAAQALAMVQPHYTGYTAQKFRDANAAMVDAQMEAAALGASAEEINAACEWNGVPL